jgi:hypothetical protein
MVLFYKPSKSEIHCNVVVTKHTYKQQQIFGNQTPSDVDHRANAEDEHPPSESGVAAAMWLSNGLPLLFS